MMAACAGGQDFQSLVLSCNKDGMDALRKGQSQAAFEQFKYAEAILIANQTEGDNTGLLAVTCNNLGCYYKKVGKLHGALSYLRRALKMEVELSTDNVTIAGTHLNICAILSKLEKHDKAVQHALCALELINGHITESEPSKVSQDDYSVLAIAYHNVAVERDFLEQYDKAAAAFQQGFQVAKQCLGEDHPLAITLGKNCDAVLQKSQRLSKAAINPFGSSRFAKASPVPSLLRGSQSPGDSELPPLPALPGAQPGAMGDEELPMPQASVRQDAANWVANEETAWTSFAKTALSGAPAVAEVSPMFRGEPKAGLTKQAGESLRAAQAKDLAVPQWETDCRSTSFGSSAPRAYRIKKTPFAQALDDHPEALMDIIDADRTGYTAANVRSAPNDYRPNRMIKGTTRTARVVRRTGLYNCTRHRDQVMSGKLSSAVGAQKTAYVQRMAAERIQRAWRGFYKYCTENSDWMTTTWVAATMIQAHWRSYHVRRVKLDRAAATIQRHVRGHLVRKVLRKHKAAVTIQRHIFGVLTRMKLLRLRCAAVRIEALARGFLARRRVGRKRTFLTRTATIIQSAVRVSFARKRVNRLRAEARARKVRVKAVTDMQRLYRGWKGRKRFAAAKEQYMLDLKYYQAATKMQALIRRDAAIKRVDQLRMEKLANMTKAATLVRKMWLGAKSRRRYRELLGEFSRHTAQIVVMQRHARGFLVRVRLWRQAIRAEEQLWGAVQIQRIWRGYLGRVAFESKYEEVWRREMAALMIQRHIRGWLARTRVGRLRRRIARSEFERARKRFRSAQKIQALARGVLSRKVTRARRARILWSVIEIQRTARGHALRCRLWKQVTGIRARLIQAAARGFLVRKRRMALLARVIQIQRAWRRWRRRPEDVRRQATEAMRERRRNASIIQKKFRSFSESQAVSRILQTDHE